VSAFTTTRILVVLSLAAQSALAAPRCAITIREVLNSGSVESVTFRSDLKSPAQCETLAGMHRKNFAPSRVRNKQVAYSWNGPAAPRVARASVKKPAKKAQVAYRKAVRTKRQNF